MNLDKFYTKPSIAGQCVDVLEDIIPLSTFTTIIEPSAGDGAFLAHLPTSRIALDIEPEADGIVKQDWFDYAVMHTEPTLVIGNPPFGERSSLAKDFIRHSAVIGADVVAFILPVTFKKLSNQSVNIIPKDYKLAIVHDLPRDSFLADGEEYGLTCSFFVWVKDTIAYDGKDLRKKKIKDTKDFQFLNRESGEADFCINGNNGKVKSPSEITNKKAEHYIRATGVSKDDLIQRFESLEYEWLSSVPGGNAWISRQEILEAYTKKYK